MFFASQAKNMAAAAAGFVGVGSAIAGIATAAALIRAELNNLRAKQSKSGEARVTYETALADAISNTLPTGFFTADEVDAKSKRIALDAGISPARGAQLLGSAVTSTGVSSRADAETAIQAAVATARIAPGLEGSGQESLAGVAASLGKSFGVAPSAAIGFSERVRGQSNVRDQGAFASNVAPGLQGLTDFGFKPEEAGGLIATLTQRGGDTEGSTSKTAALNLAAALEERFRGTYERDGKFDPSQAIAALQGDPELRRKFLEGGEFRGKTFGKAALGKQSAIPGIKQVLTPGTVGAREFSEFTTSIGGLDKGQETYDQLVGARDAAQPTAGLDRKLGAAIDRLAVEDETGISGIVRKHITNLRQQLGTSALGQRIGGISDEFESDFGRDPKAAVSGVVEELVEASEEQAGRKYTGEKRTVRDGRSGSRGLRRVHVTRAANEAELQQSRLLEQMAVLIRQQQLLIENQSVRDGDVKITTEFRINNRKADADVRVGPKPRPATALSQ